MPWKIKSKEEQRFDLLVRMKRGEVSVTKLCRQFRISRKTAYKWRERWRMGGLKGLQDGSHRPAEVFGRTSGLWLQRLRETRRQYATWGARKLRYSLVKRFGQKGVPSIATIGRWLKRWGLVVSRKRRLPGPVMIRPAVRPGRSCHDVWTVDFKGWYRTRDGTRVDPLTVRDLYSRYGLAIRLLRHPRLKETQREFVRLFKQFGLPKRIRCDNGTPFGGGGPTGLTRLSAWWVKLGIRVDFITPGRPCENGAHEQFHRVYKTEVAKHPAQSLAGQQRRSTQWLKHYNQERPHEALQFRVPARLFRKNPRRMPKQIKPWKYPAPWKPRWVKGNGEINWLGQRRFVGEAFVRDYVGLQPVRKDVWRVYFGPLLIGELHQKEKGSIRMAKYRLEK
jgi:putative transposase